MPCTQASMLMVFPAHRHTALPCCRQPDPSAAGLCPPTAGCKWRSPPLRWTAARTSHRRAAAGRDPETAARQDLWSEDLANTSWAEGWAPSEDSQQEEPPQIWPEPEVWCWQCMGCCRHAFTKHIFACCAMGGSIATTNADWGMTRHAQIPR
jgi:hypothetical protein